MDRRDEADELLRLLPPIGRARLWRLYAREKAEGLPGRFLDLWMDGGRAILGAKGTGLGTVAKAAIDRGLTRPMPSAWERRLEKALLADHPGYAAARFYRSEEEARLALASFLGKGELEVLDSASRESAAASSADAVLERPFAAYLPGFEAAGRIAPAFALPLLPCPSALAPGAVLARDAAKAPRGELAPPMKLEAAARALGEFARLTSTYDEALWRRADRRLSAFFERRGPYLYPRHGAAEHGEFFRKALSAGLLVSPVYELPSILPADFDDGELAALAKRL
jgi:hypothetical protein